VRKYISVCVLLAGTWGCHLVRGQNSHEHGLHSVTVSYSYPQQLGSLQPVILTLNVKNESSEAIMLDLGQDRKGNFSFTLTTPIGTKLKLPQYSRDGISRVGTVSISSGRSYSQSLLLNEWYEFSEPGKYELEGHLTSPIVVGNGLGSERDPGFHAVIQIGPKDDLALEKTCATLANQIDESNSYEEAAAATLTLSYIKQPLAVPYLRRALLAHKLIEPLAIAGLERIGDETAVRVLFEGLRLEDPNTVVLCRSALQRLQNQTPDSNLRLEIELGLIASRSPRS
jgi:hypothetical protein